MKSRTKAILAGSLAAAILAGGAVFAKESAESITAVYRNIKLVVDGVLIEPKDANGDTVEPFIYNGTTYLPVRAVAEAFEKPVAWDGENSTVYLGGEVDKPAKELELWNRSYTEVSNADVIKTYQKDGIGYIFFGKKYNRFTVNPGGGREHQVERITYPLNSLAKTISGEFYATGKQSDEFILRIYDSNGREIYESPIMRTSTAPVTFDVNVENEITVTLETECLTSDEFGDSSMYIKNPKIVSADY